MRLRSTLSMLLAFAIFPLAATYAQPSSADKNFGPASAPKTEKAAEKDASSESAVEKDERAAPPSTYRRIPLGSMETRAPRPAGAPSPMVRETDKKGQILDVLTQPLDVGTGSMVGLQEVDWTQPLRDIKADVVGGAMGGDTIDAKGNVRLQIDTLSFSADQFSHNKRTGEMQAEGGVIIKQELSVVSADKFYYRIREEGELPKPSMLDLPKDEQEREKRRLSLGRIDVTN
ncbi:MAG: hypothetical protein QG656_1895, partial [Candidatus Hydrogenedentes bacterium]|nr:hypothetical protein [Candidatus Hydrogenedentota bacterium]